MIVPAAIGPARPMVASRPWAMLLIVLLVGFACLLGTAMAQTLPPLSGRVVDQANLLPADQEAALAGRLEALERTTSRQLVVVTVPNLQGYEDEDFAYRLGTAWKLGNAEADNGAILLVAVAERKIRIEVGDGLEPILTDAMSYIIIRDQMTPRFRQNDYVGGINAGTAAIIQQLQAPPEEAERRALQAAQQQRQQQSRSSGGSIFPAIFWIIVVLMVLIPMLRRAGRGRRYGTRGRRSRGGWGGPIVVWGGDSGIGGGWGSGGGGWSGGSGGGFGGFSGGGGSFGGGGASGGW